ncbi:hypothetical protein [Parasutterella sp.]|uniref:hypothetical protein n=1 Tax=Parasutterella sp. TaxID=2049037 RepID=UPI003AF94A4A
MKKLLLSLSLFFSISNASALTISHVGEQFLGHGVSDLTFEVSSCEAYKNLVITLKFIGKDNKVLETKQLKTSISEGEFIQMICIPSSKRITLNEISNDVLYETKYREFPAVSYSRRQEAR